MEQPSSAEPYAPPPLPTAPESRNIGQRSDRSAFTWSDHPDDQRGQGPDDEADIDPDPYLGRQSSMDGDLLPEARGTAIPPKPRPAGRHRLRSAQENEVDPLGSAQNGMGDPGEDPTDPPTGVAVDGPQPVRPWEIGNPGDSFTQIQPLFGRTLDAPDTVLDGGQLGPLSVYAASVRGLSHRQKGGPRQDAYAVSTSADERWLVVTVADGLSSAQHSHRAAQLVARHATHQAARLLHDRTTPLTRTEWYDLFQQLSRRILSTGEQRLKLPRHEVPAAMATTVTILVCPTEAENGQRQVQVAWLGDSPAWVIEADRTWNCLTEVKGAGQEVASSKTVALPQLPDDPANLPVRTQWVSVHAVMLAMSDGVGDPLGDGTGDVGTALARAWSGVPASALDFALQVGFGRKSYDDDRTVVGVWDPAGIEP
ncbi:hypothetical protein E0H26_03500 [Micromonospora zingiberis]|uniref:PPM-type phosphatase domain-containing protein n=1 Tax=Micromonospora zingiberis TaxID=2053011 RepID=A0A4R0GQ02_9ACTN|nr:protein phosphatase 2C domain-containing protein [Micromonospora zingiberis]TCB99636.1 hypothetical protein E0H26_03500 [Micromonospora zingiberis]